MTPASNEASLAARLEDVERRLARLETSLAGARSASMISILIPLIDYIRADDLPEDRKVLLSLKEGELREVHGVEYEELVRPSRRACSSYDVLGILLKEVDDEVREVFYQNWGDSIVGCFKAAERSGLLDMERANNPNRWKNFEQLAHKVESYIQSVGQGNATKNKR
ncbi:MAG: hypothetical protein FJ403_01875 [Verrucomicrobia bacterium]|nr:hypothetical protein [Verrucomicrobiota bacterium]